MTRHKKGPTPPRRWQPLQGPVSGAYADGRAAEGEYYGNELYSCQVTRFDSDPPGAPQLVQISIHRRDRRPVSDWRHMQRIKNEILGPEFEAVQLFPAESRLLDTANEYHLWAYSDAEFRFPVGFHERLVMEHSELTPGSRQRPLDPDTEGVTSDEEYVAMLRDRFPSVAEELGLAVPAEHRHRECGPACCITGDLCEDAP